MIAKLLLTFGLLILVCGCEPKEAAINSSETSAAEPGSGEGVDGDSSTNADIDAATGSLELQFDDTAPAHLAISAPTATVASETLANGQIQVPAALSLDGHMAPGDEGGGGSSGPADYTSKVANIQKALAGASSADCTAAIPQEFGFAMGNLNHAKCFGPAITLTNHPELDSSSAAGGIGNGDAGMFWDYAEPSETSGEACGARVVANTMKNVASYGDAAIGFHAFASCAATIAKTKLPAIGASEDISTAVSSIDTTALNFAIASASIEREADASDGAAVFVTKLSGQMEDVARGMTKNFRLEVRHITATADATKYRGVVRYIVEDFETGNDLGISLRYSWSEASLRYRYRHAQINAASSTNFDSNNEVKIAEATGQSKWTEVINNNDKSGLGKTAITIWNSDLNILNAETKADGTGVAYFGHRNAENTDFAGTTANLIEGLKCLPINPPPPNTDPFTPYVQRQTLKLNAEGIWALDQSHISFAPTSTCNWTESEDSSGSATFTASNDGNSKTLTFPMTNNLMSKADYDANWTAPVLPDDL